MLKTVSTKNQEEGSTKKLSWFNRVALFFNFVAVLCVFISYSAKYISPAKYWLFAFFGLGYPVLFFINIFFVLYWILQLKKYFLISLVSILFGYQSFFSYCQFNFSNSSVENNSLRVITYNCMLFDLYNWRENVGSRNKIFTMLSKENPDILCLQEFYTSENPSGFDNLHVLSRLLKFPYHSKHYTTTLRQTDHWGIITFSKFPIVNSGVLVFQTKTNNACIFSDVVIDRDTVRVYNIHLQSIQFGKEDYKYVSDVIKNKNNQDLQHGKSILRRLKKGFTKRATQSEMISKHIEGCRYKIILCGDFNDTPTSYAYHKVRGNLMDAFFEKGRGLETTYNGDFPAFRIDNIFHSHGIKTNSYKKIDNSLTDHSPVLVTFKLE